MSPWLHVVTLLLLVRPQGDSSFFFMCVWKETERGVGDRVETLPRDPKKKKRVVSCPVRDDVAQFHSLYFLL